MKTLVVVSGSTGLIWSEIPNSAQPGTTLSATVGGRCYHFAIDHVHIDIDHDLRVLCLEVILPHSGQFLIKEETEGWFPRNKATLNQNAAIGQAVKAWDNK